MTKLVQPENTAAYYNLTNKINDYIFPKFFPALAEYIIFKGATFVSE